MPQTLDVSRQDIRSLRRATGLTIAGLSRLAGVSAGILRQIERGLRSPERTVLDALAKALRTSGESLARAHRELMRNAQTGEGYVTARPESAFVLPRRDPFPSAATPILDLFCGTGGFSHGFERTGQFAVCAGIDLLPDRVQTFSANHPTAVAHCRDIHDVDIDRLLDGSPRPEIIIGGPPCQGFSSIRPFRNLVISDRRNNLFEHYALVVQTIRPSWFVMENVVGLLTHQRGETLRTIIDIFADIGYTTSWAVLNAALYGLPQRRERCVVVGSREGKGFAWPEPTHFLAEHKSMAGKRYGQCSGDAPLFGRSLAPANTVMNAIHDLPRLESGQSCDTYRDDVEMTAYEKTLRNGETKLTLHDATRHSEKMLRIIRHAGNNINALPPGLVTSGFSSCYSRLEPDRPAVTMTVNFVHPASNKCIHPYQDRALTPREGARLQGFPDSFRFVGTRAQVVKQIGNAVPPLLGQVIATALLRSMA